MKEPPKIGLTNQQAANITADILAGFIGWLYANDYYIGKDIGPRPRELDELEATDTYDAFCLAEYGTKPTTD